MTKLEYIGNLITSNLPTLVAASKLRSGGGADDRSDVTGQIAVEGGGGFGILVADVLSFLLINLLIAQQVVNIMKPSNLQRSSVAQVSLTGNRTRSTLMGFLFAASTVRILSLIVVFIWTEDSKDFSSHPKSAALLFVCQSFPSMLFISSYSIIVLFWAQVYFAAILYAMPMLRLLFVFLNIAAHCIYAAIVLSSLSFGAYNSLRLSASFYVESLFFVLAFLFAYFGFKVARQLSACKSISRKDSIIKRVIFLAVLCPLLFLFRSLYYFAFLLGAFPSYHPKGISKNIWISLIQVASEAVPSFCILLTFWSRKSSRDEERDAMVDNQIGTTDLRSPLIQYSYMGPPAVLNFSQPPRPEDFDESHSTVRHEIYNQHRGAGMLPRIATEDVYAGRQTHAFGT